MIYNTKVVGYKNIKGKTGLYAKVCFPLPGEMIDGGRMYAEGLLPVPSADAVSVDTPLQVCTDRFGRVLDINILREEVKA